MAQVAREKLVALGTCVGKFTHSGKFRLTVGALDVLAQYAKYKARGKGEGPGALALVAAARGPGMSQLVGEEPRCSSCGPQCNCSAKPPPASPCQNRAST